MRVDLQKLEYFHAVRDHGSINAAAASMGVAQPTISQALRSLEREFGVELFHRIGRGMALTSAGYALVGPARRLLRDTATAASSVRDHAGNLRGALDVAVAPSLTSGLVVKLVAEVHRRWPLTRINLIELPDDISGIDQIREGHHELLITHLPQPTLARARPGDPLLATLELGTQEYWVALPPGEDLGLPPGDGPVPMEALSGVPLVSVPPGSSVHSGEIQAELERTGKSTPPAAVLQHREARLAFAAAGVGATFLERSMAENARVRGVVMRPTEPLLTRDYGIVYDPAGPSPVARAFLSVAADLVNGSR